jgi:hypothetical protein
MDDLTKHEVETLEMLAGRREEKRGAMVSMCLDYLQRRGYCTPGPNHAITPEGLAILAGRDAGREGDAASVPARRWRLRSIRGQIVCLQPGRVRAARRA